MSLGLALGDAAFVVNPVPDCQPALRFNEEGILFEGQSLQVAIHAAGGCAHLCFSFSKLPVCFRELLCPPVTDGRGVPIGVVVEGLDFHEPTLEGKGRLRKPGGAFAKSRRVISHETDLLQMVEFVFDLSMWLEGRWRLPQNRVDPGSGNRVLGGYQPRPCRKA